MIYDELRRYLAGFLDYNTDNLRSLSSFAEINADIKRVGALLAYLRQIQADYASYSVLAKNRFEQQLAIAKMKYASSKMSETQKNDLALANDEQLRQLRDQLADREACVVYVKHIIESYEIIWNTLSRLLTSMIAESEVV